MKASKEVLDIINSAIVQEFKSRDFYRHVASQMVEGGARLKLDIMADTEEEHGRILSGLYKELTGEDFVASEYKQGFPLEIETPTRDSSIHDIVKIIYEAEERAYAFYKSAADSVEDPEQKKVFLKLAQMEKSHEELFRGEYQALVEDTSIRFADEEIPWMIEAME